MSPLNSLPSFPICSKIKDDFPCVVWEPEVAAHHVLEQALARLLRQLQHHLTQDHRHVRKPRGKNGYQFYAQNIRANLTLLTRLTIQIIATLFISNYDWNNTTTKIGSNQIITLLYPKIKKSRWLCLSIAQTCRRSGICSRGQSRPAESSGGWRSPPSCSAQNPIPLF